MRKPIVIEDIVQFAKRNRVAIDRSIATSGVLRIQSIRRKINKASKRHYLDPYYIVALCSALEWDAKSKLHFAFSSIDLSLDDIKSIGAEIKFDIGHFYALRRERFGLEDIIISQFNISSIEQYLSTTARALQVVSKSNNNLGWFIDKHRARTKVDSKRYGKWVADLSRIFDKRNLIVHELPENISGLASQPLVARTELRAFAASADNVATLLYDVFVDEYLHGPYGEKNYEALYGAKILAEVEILKAVQEKIKSEIGRKSKMLHKSDDLFLALMFNDRDVIALSKHQRGEKDSVRFPMVLSYLQLRCQMLEIILEEIQGMRFASERGESKF